MRKKLKEAESDIKVAKKTLAEIAFRNTKVSVEPKKMKGEIALVFGFGEIVPPAKLVWQLSQEGSGLKILGGYLDEQFVAPAKIIELAKLPGQKELLSRLVGSLSAPMSNFVNVLQGNIKGLVYALSAIKK